MKLLAMDTSTVACSVALGVGGDVDSRHALEPRAHAQLLLPMIDELLAAAGLDAGELDAVILGNGPGSFIGLRIAAAVAQGLCYAGGAALVPVSSLAAVARAALAAGTASRVLVAQDAHMNEVYLEGYEVGSSGEVTVCRPVALVPAGTVPALDRSGWLAAGAGWTRYPQLFQACRERLAGRSAADYPHASDLLALGAAGLAAGQAIAPESLEPCYVRERVATPPGGRGAARGGS